jgi:hypothetical protein
LLFKQVNIDEQQKKDYKTRFFHCLGDYAAEMIVFDKNKKIVIMARGYAAIVKV